MNNPNQTDSFLLGNDNLPAKMNGVLNALYLESGILSDLVGNFTLKRIKYIHEQSLGNAKEIYDEIMSGFYDKNINEIIYDITNSDQSDLYSRYLSGRFLNDFNGKDPQKEGFLLLYYLSFYYISKFFVWRDNLNNEFKTKVDVVGLFGSQIGQKMLDTTNRLIDKESFQTDEDKEFAYNLLLRMLSIIITQTNQDNRGQVVTLLSHISSFRIKSPKTSIYKLMRGIKYWKIMKDNGVLEDGVGLLLETDSLVQLKQIANLACNTLPKSNISKYSDKGVISTDFENSHSVDGMFPFLNLGVILTPNNISLGEMMFKCSEFKERDMIFSNLKQNNVISKVNNEESKKSTYQCNDYDKFFKECMNSYNVNHCVYRMSQIISIIGTMLDYSNIQDLLLDASIDDKIKQFIEYQICLGVQQTYDEISKAWKHYFSHANKIIGKTDNKYDINIENSIDKSKLEGVIKLYIINFIKSKSVDKNSKTGLVIEKTTNELINCLGNDFLKS